MVLGQSHSSAEADRRGSASSHGPSRKLTYVSVSVKGNIVNTNVYKIWNVSDDQQQLQIDPLACDYLPGAAPVHTVVIHIVNNMVKCPARLLVLVDEVEPLCSSALRELSWLVTLVFGPNPAYKY